MGENRMDTAPSAPSLTSGAGRRPSSPVAEPTAAADPYLQLTPVPGPRAPRNPSAGTAGAVVTGIAVLVITAELGRRAGAPARLIAVWSAGACAVVIAPRLLPLPGLRHRPVLAGVASPGNGR
ncbi:hypothetical protein E1293_02325 [Actinomadura darangshiensis]|uniref:Uncharacterized protein n=1 Tax=Actinomadura darangshiensis TaxID=705336 RepID=A0A4R5BW95_9ACTN|nr:hypothetical protein [Actinomadura darangshiensis]TDD91438.1 hypothetical protein E1293_02325 [Actinomadura darangshiensis]